MAFPWTAPGTGTDQELLDLARAAIAQILATGQSYAIAGRQLTRADLPELRETVQWLETRLTAQAGDSTENLVRLRRR